LSPLGNLLWNQSFVDGSYNYTVQNPLVGDVDGDGKNEVVFGTKHKYPYVNDYVIYVYSQPNHPPSVTVTAPANGSVWNESDNVTFSYNVSDENAVSSCSLFIGGEERDNSSNVSKGSLQHFSQNLSNGRYEWSVTCRDEYGKEGSSGVLVLDVDYQPPEPPEPAPEEKPKRRSSGGGLYRPPEPLPSVTKLWGRVMPGDELSMTLEKEGVAIRMIVMEVNEESMSVSLEVTGLEEKPADIEEAGGSVYQYLSIEQSNLESLDSAVIGFCVNRSWVESNGLDEEDVVLNRYSDGWKPLNTSLVSEGGGEFCYEASTPGFSYFAITGSEQAVIGEDSCGNGRCDSQETCVSCPEDCGECHEEAGTAGEGTVPASEGTDNGGITGLITFLLSWLALPLFLIVAALILASAVILQRR
jgi:PGF-pre-PGF domain-containing protein